MTSTYLADVGDIEGVVDGRSEMNLRRDQKGSKIRQCTVEDVVAVVVIVRII